MNASADVVTLQTGARVPVRHFQPDEVDLFLFSAASWLPHCIHYDRDFSRSEGHRDLLIHGPLQGTYLVQFVAEWIAPAGGRVRQVRYRHLSPAHVGDDLECTGIVTQVTDREAQREITVEVSLTNSATGLATTSGTIVALVPRDSSNTTEPAGALESSEQ